MSLLILGFIAISFTFVNASNAGCTDSSCSSCSSGYLYNSLCCPPQCPTGYSSSSAICIAGPSQNLFSIQFFSFTAFTATEIQGFTHPLGLPFNDAGKGSAVPTKDRGFYFVSTSRLVSTTSWVPGPDLTLRFGTKCKSAGTIFEIADNSNSYFKLYCDSSAFYANWILEASGSTATVQISVGNTGFFAFFILIGNQLSELFTLSFGSVLRSFPTSEFKAQLSGLNFCFGGCAAGTSFQGFLY
jgi:hypothetical protein